MHADIRTETLLRNQVHAWFKNQQAGPYSIQKLFNETFELIIHNYISVLSLVGFAN